MVSMVGQMLDGISSTEFHSIRDVYYRPHRRNSFHLVVVRTTSSLNHQALDKQRHWYNDLRNGSCQSLKKEPEIMNGEKNEERTNHPWWKCIHSIGIDDCVLRYFSMHLNDELSIDEQMELLYVRWVFDQMEILENSMDFHWILRTMKMIYLSNQRCDVAILKIVVDVDYHRVQRTQENP